MYPLSWHFFFFFLLACCQYLPWLNSTLWTLLNKTTQANKLPDQRYISKEGKLMPSYKVESACLWSVTQLRWLFVTAQIAACQAPLSVEFPRQVCWSGSPFPSHRDRPVPGIEPTSPACPAWTVRFFTTEPSENKTAKDKLTLQFGDIKLKLFLVYHSENPRAFKNIATGSLPVVWKRNPKM